MAGKKKSRAGKAILIGAGTAALVAGAALTYLMYIEWRKEGGGDCRSFFEKKGVVQRTKGIFNKCADDCHCAVCREEDEDDDCGQLEFDDDDFITPRSK